MDDNLTRWIRHLDARQNQLEGVLAIERLIARGAVELVPPTKTTGG